MEPFAILLILILHQTEESELLQKWMKANAIGIRIKVSDMPVMAGIFVRPQPKNAPVAMSSRQIKSCEKPSIRK